MSAEIETFSPFIPLDYDNSSLPVTVMEISLKNSGTTAASVGLEAYLENAALRFDPSTTTATTLRRVAQTIPLPGGAMVLGAVAQPAGVPDSTPPLKNLRDWGSMALAILGDKAQAQASRGSETATAETPLSEV
jgi:non-lysosomal glucosylceramidase